MSAANAALISDHAPEPVFIGASDAEQGGEKLRARFVGLARRARLPSEFSIAPVHAITGLLEQIGWMASDVDRWEINEAFAPITMLAMKEHGVTGRKINVHSCALAHLDPSCAANDGALRALIESLEETCGTRGIAALRICGDEVAAIAVERG